MKQVTNLYKKGLISFPMQIGANTSLITMKKRGVKVPMHCGELMRYKKRFESNNSITFYCKRCGKREEVIKNGK